jgi:hypothetical protein
MTTKKTGATPWGRQPHGKKLDKLFNALVGLGRKDDKNLIREVAEELADQAECDDLLWLDADEDGPMGGTSDPDIPIEQIYERHEFEWLNVIRKHDRKFDKIVTQFLSLHKEEEKWALEELEEEFTDVLFGRVLKDFDGEELQDNYDEIRGQCADADAEARDPYGYRGLSRSDFYGSDSSARTAHRWMQAKGDIPKEVEEKAKEVEKSNPDYDDAKVWATAWSIYCKHIEPGSDHCSKKPGEYLKKKATELEDFSKAVIRKFPGASFNKKQQMWDLGDGRMVMFVQQGDKTTLDVWTSDSRPEKIKMNIPVKSESDAVSAIKRLKKASRTAGGEVTISDVERFVKRQRTYMEEDHKDQRSLSLITRENGDVGEEEPGRADFAEARRVGQAVLKEFGKDAVSVGADYMDEWVTLNITLKDIKRKTALDRYPPTRAPRGWTPPEDEGCTDEYMDEIEPVFLRECNRFIHRVILPALKKRGWKLDVDEAEDSDGEDGAYAAINVEAKAGQKISLGGKRYIVLDRNVDETLELTMLPEMDEMDFEGSEQFDVDEFEEWSWKADCPTEDLEAIEYAGSRYAPNPKGVERLLEAFDHEWIRSNRIQSKIKKRGGRDAGDKKKVAPHMYVISKIQKGRYMITLGDPRSSRAKIIRQGEAWDMKDWYGDQRGKISDDHIIDVSGLKLVSDKHSDFHESLAKAAGADRELLKDWSEHVQKNRRRWEGRKYDADDWYDEALEFAGDHWKFHNLDPWDDIPKREIERYAEDNAPDMLTHVDAPSASRVAERHLA